MLQGTGFPGGPELGLFVVATFVLNATPGVDLLLTVTRTLQGGARAGLAAALGIGAGCIGHACAAAFGLAAALAVHPEAFTAIKLAGAAYLGWLALGMARSAWRGARAGATPAATARQVAPRSAWTDFRAGVLTNALNPKVALFFLAFLPQFIDPQAGHKTLGVVLLGLWFFVQSTLFLAGVVWLAARARTMGASPRAARVLQACGATLFAALALRLLAARPTAPV
jgi:threonine/homoserine/homoserine lactone efflux protein